MTTILAIQYEEGFQIAADSFVTENERPYKHKKVGKITQNGEYIIAGAGNSRFCDSIQYAWTPPRYDGSDIYRFIVSVFIPAMRRQHEESGCVVDKDDVFKFIVGLDNTLFYIPEDYSVLMSDTGIYGAGTGAPYGIGALQAGATLKEAMKIAINNDINSGGNVQILKRGKIDA